MYLKIDQEELDEIEKITDVNYEREGNYLPLDSIKFLIKDLVYEFHKLQREKEDYEEDIKENYEPKKFKPYEEYGVSERDFI